MTLDELTATSLTNLTLEALGNFVGGAMLVTGMVLACLPSTRTAARRA